ncbi:hypothetical protein QFC22_005368 [Naganishia vaughanmartiniae]|uniref:Uncharacterized protein n=1 Tax=Naganishia vaughanmartiniae TaxID=1424756 RepID=A0ACC2WUP4_9TREE|nr:hypothetical protein QFC22_005368 [Naganishia vaughanmartiniae]
MAQPPLPSTSQTSQASAAPATALIPNPTYLAITESIAFYTYRQQNSLLTLLSLPPVSWESLVPRPTVSLEEVERHVQGVRKFCGVREDGVVIQPGQGKEGKVVDIEEEGRRVIKSLKEEEEATGTAAIIVELDGKPFKLVLPQLDELSKDQRTALALHARHTRIIDALRAYLKGLEVFIPPPSPIVAAHHPAPTPTIAPPLPAIPTHLRLRTIARLLPRFIGAAIKVEIGLWMITRSLPSSDWRYWMFVAGAVGWLVWECHGMYSAERGRMRVAREREVRERERQARAAAEAIGREGVVQHVPGVPMPADQANLQQRQRPAMPRHRTRNNNSNRPNPLPLVGLAYERRLLRLFYLPPSQTPINNQTDRRIPSTDLNLPLAPPDPSLLWTYLVIPVYMLLLSLWPDGDTARKRAIRERETHMRLLSLKLTEAAEADARARASAATKEEENGSPPSSLSALPTTNNDKSQSTQPGPEPQPTPTPTRTAATAIIPRNLSSQSERYWRRVLARGETIDWDEERAAQERVLRAAGRGGAGQGEEEGGMGFL